MGRELSNAVVFFHEAVASRLGMSAAEWKCLGLLDQHGPSTRAALPSCRDLQPARLPELLIAWSEPAMCVENRIRTIDAA